jgi:hypothetical protein
LVALLAWALSMMLVAFGLLLTAANRSVENERATTIRLSV